MPSCGVVVAPSQRLSSVLVYAAQGKPRTAAILAENLVKWCSRGWGRRPSS